MSYTDKELIQKISEIRKYNDDHLTRCEDEVLRSAAMRIAELQSRLEELSQKVDELEKEDASLKLRLETIRALYPSAPSDEELDIAINAALQSANKGE